MFILFRPLVSFNLLGAILVTQKEEPQSVGNFLTPQYSKGQSTLVHTIFAVKSATVSDSILIATILSRIRV